MLDFAKVTWRLNTITQCDRATMYFFVKPSFCLINVTPFIGLSNDFSKYPNIDSCNTIVLILCPCINILYQKTSRYAERAF